MPFIKIQRQILKTLVKFDYHLISYKSYIILSNHSLPLSKIGSSSSLHVTSLLFSKQSALSVRRLFKRFSDPSFVSVLPVWRDRNYASHRSQVELRLFARLHQCTCLLYGLSRSDTKTSPNVCRSCSNKYSLLNLRRLVTLTTKCKHSSATRFLSNIQCYLLLYFASVSFWVLFYLCKPWIWRPKLSSMSAIV